MVITGLVSAVDRCHADGCHHPRVPRLVGDSDRGVDFGEPSPNLGELADRLVTEYGREKLAHLLTLMEDFEVVLEEIADSNEDTGGTTGS